jgi:hypothetical protein
LPEAQIDRSQDTFPEDLPNLIGAKGLPSRIGQHEITRQISLDELYVLNTWGTETPYESGHDN